MFPFGDTLSGELIPITQDNEEGPPEEEECIVPAGVTLLEDIPDKI